jgi:signal transduction histidine kinase
LKMFANSPDCGPHIRVIKNFHEDVFIPGDPQQIRQVFWNLLINAAQAMPSGGELSIELRRHPPLFSADDPGLCEISVTDTGPGIAKDILGKIFDPFFTTKEKGTGLGLAIVHSIVNSYGGKVTVQSQEGKGANISVFLPASKSQQ